MYFVKMSCIIFLNSSPFKVAKKVCAGGAHDITVRLFFVMLNILRFFFLVNSCVLCVLDSNVKLWRSHCLYSCSLLTLYDDLWHLQQNVSFEKINEDEFSAEMSLECFFYCFVMVLVFLGAVPIVAEIPEFFVCSNGFLACLGNFFFGFGNL